MLSLLSQLEVSIREKAGHIKLLKREELKDEEQIGILTQEIEDLQQKYAESNEGKRFVPSLEIQAKDFCEDYVAEIERNDRSEKYKNLRLKHEIIKVTSEKDPSNRCHLIVECTLKIKINDDAPRKVLEIFRLNESTETDSNPLVIASETFIIQDSRPLYHWPEYDIPKTSYDNWEPQFKPAPPVVEEKVEEAVVAEEKKKDDGSDDEGSLPEGESLEESVEEDMKSLGSLTQQQNIVDDSNAADKNENDKNENIDNGGGVEGVTSAIEGDEMKENNEAKDENIDNIENTAIIDSIGADKKEDN